MTGDSEFEEWKYRRLWNWGRSEWGALMAAGPDSSCANPIYDMGPRGDPEGYADETDEGLARTITYLSYDPGQAGEIDEADAEVVGGWIKQLAQGHRAILCRRYVLRDQCPHGTVDAAIRALLTLKHDNRRSVMRVQWLLRRWERG